MSLLSLSPAALSHLRMLQQKRNTPLVFRIYVEGGGCYGFQYQFSLISIPQEGDIIEQVDPQIQVAIEALSADLLKGTVIDYEADLMQAGFVAKNPNAQSACGCGTSFSV